MNFKPIALVGQGCVLPGAHTPRKFFNALAEGQNLLSEAPRGYWRMPYEDVIAGARDIQAKAYRDRAWTSRGGYVSGFEGVFSGQGYLPEAGDVNVLDTMTKWSLHAGLEALRDAGLTPEKLKGLRAGAILGNLSYPSFSLTAFAEGTWLGDSSPPDSRARDRFNSGLPAHTLARALGLDAGAFSLDAACASSLFALKLACDKLQDGQADVMLAGAINRADDLFIHVGFTALQALSPQGLSRPFHRDADGLLPSEGAAILVLKTLERALADDDRILGVIRGIGLSNDGRSKGFLAPAREGQAAAMSSAFAGSGLGPEDIGYVECHATGTLLGDATEIHSLSRVYGESHELYLGSLKANLGHPITVAGAAGLIKVLGAFENKIIPALLSAEAPVDELKNTGFRLPETAQAWDVRPGLPRRAAVSSFGFGGNNAHVLLEEWTGDTSFYGPVGERAPMAEDTAPAPEQAAVAIVGLGIQAADIKGKGEFVRVIFEGESRLKETELGQAGKTDSIELSLKGLNFPPRDLEETLPQQLITLAVVNEALEDLAVLPGENTGVLIGMQCDAEIARYGLRWRLGELKKDEYTPEELEKERDGIISALESASVIGAMPNVPANRVNARYDFKAPSFTLSSEELSGIRALDVAVRALARGEMDAALVGATDLSVEPVQARAARALLPPERQVPGDAALVLVLKRLADARRDGEKIYAMLSARDEPDGTGADFNLGYKTGIFV